jgi:hypothetical protein
MAEAFAVIGLTASMTSLIHFSLKVAKLARKIHDSVSGTFEDLSDIEFLMMQLSGIAVRTRDHLDPPGLVTAPTETETDLQCLVEKCLDATKSLLAILEHLKSKGRKSGLESIRLAIASARKDEKITKLLYTLDRYRSQLLLYLVERSQYVLRITFLSHA